MVLDTLILLIWPPVRSGGYQIRMGFMGVTAAVRIFLKSGSVMFRKKPKEEDSKQSDEDWLAQTDGYDDGWDYEEARS